MRCLKGSFLFMMVAVLALAAGCAGPKEEAPAPAPEPAATETAAPAQDLVATAHLEGREGSGTSGEVTFTQHGDEVTVDVHVEGASPAGAHGFHVHEKGDCSAADFTSAGGHFNPAGVEHTCPPTLPRHAGDLGNIEIGEDGTGHLSLTVPASLLSVAEGDHSVVGHAVILHEGTDDCESQPTGAAGARLACGVVALGSGDMGDGDMDHDDMDHDDMDHGDMEHGEGGN